MAARGSQAAARVPVAPAKGVTSSEAAEIAEATGLPPQAAGTLVRPWQVLVREDAPLVEADPLVRTRQGRAVALDGKIITDGNARFRQTCGVRPSRLGHDPCLPPLEALPGRIRR